MLCSLQVHKKWLLQVHHRRSLRSVLPTASSAAIVRTVNVARSSTSQPGTRASNVPTAESDTSRKRYKMLNRSAYVHVQIELHVTSLLPLRPFPYFGSAHQIVNIHFLRFCASSMFLSYYDVTTSLHIIIILLLYLATWLRHNMKATLFIALKAGLRRPEARPKCL